MTHAVSLRFVAPYRSIKNLPNVDLGKFTVICGPNGSGKSHLLQAIENGKIRASGPDRTQLRAKIFDGLPTLTAKSVTYADLESSRSAAENMIKMIDALETVLAAGIEATNVLVNLNGGQSWLLATRETVMTAIKSYLGSGIAINFNAGSTEAALKEAVAEQASFKKYVPSKILKDISSFDATILKERILEFVEYQNFMNIDISTVFYRYFEEVQNNAYARASGGASLDDAAFKEKFGNPPWDEVNQMLGKHGFRHHFIAPDVNTDSKATKGFTAKIRCEEGTEITVNDLSSGERVIIALLLSAYATQQQDKKIFQLEAPDLILFDELDAHLHPSLTRMMFDVLQVSIVEKLARPVIITTHSPSTVALAPKDSVYKLTPGATHALNPIQREAAARELSDGFIQVIDSSQIVIVEGRDDPPFYRAIERALRSLNEMENIPTLHFIPASKSDDPSFGGGASSAVDWANKLEQTNLPNIHALLDRDKGTADSGIIKVLAGRYAIENFILDPLSLAIALITDQKLSAIDVGLGTQFSQVSALETADQASMQNLVNSICRFVETNAVGLVSTPVDVVNYHRGIVLELPHWVSNTRGKDLVPKIRQAFQALNTAYVITRKDIAPYNIELGYLLKLWSQHPMLFPNDLLNTLSKFTAI